MNQTENKKHTSEKFDELKIGIYFSDFIKGLKKFWWLCVALAVLLGGFKLAVGYSDYIPLYRASATFTVSTQSTDQTVDGASVYSFFYNSSTASQIAKTFPYLMSSSILKDEICEDLGVSALDATLSTTCVEDSNMITISATGADPQKTYDVLISSINNLPKVAKYIVGNIKLTAISEPYVPTEPSNRFSFVESAIKWAAIGFGVGLMLIALYVVLRNTIKTKSDIRTLLNMDCIGVLPRISSAKQPVQMDSSVLLTNPKTESIFLESLRVLRNTLVNSLEPDEKVIMMTSTAPSEGKTTVITNLALSLADCGKKVLLVDADTHNPSVESLLEIDPKKLEKYGEMSDNNIVHLDKYKVSFMSFTSVEKAEKNGRMNTERIKKVFDSVRDEYDYIFVDTPPCGLISDSLFFANASDVALYVVLQDTVRVTKIRSGLDNILSSNVRVLGCVLNGALPRVTGYGYGYGNRYGYGDEKNASNKKTKKFKFKNHS